MTDRDGSEDTLSRRELRALRGAGTRAFPYPAPVPISNVLGAQLSVTEEDAIQDQEVDPARREHHWSDVKGLLVTSSVEVPIQTPEPELEVDWAEVDEALRAVDDEHHQTVESDWPSLDLDATPKPPSVVSTVTTSPRIRRGSEEPEARRLSSLPLWAQWVGWIAAIGLGIAAVIATVLAR